MKYVIFFLICLNVNAQWTALNGPFNNQNSNDSRVMAIDNNNIFVALSSSRGIFKTSDNGMHWQEFNLGLPIANGIGIQTMSIIADNIFISSTQGVYRSNVNNCNWTPLNAPFYLNYFSNLCTNGNQIFASTSKGMYVSSDNGNSWTLNPYFGTNIINAICYDNGVLYTAWQNSSYNKVFSKSYDNGLNWINSPNGSPSGVINNILINNNKIFISAKNPTNAYTGGIYKSIDGGLNWVLTSVDNFQVNSLFKSGTKIFALGDYLKITDDEGDTWTDLYSSCGCYANYGYSSNDRVILGAYNQCTTCQVPIYFSLNSGSNWNVINKNIVDNNIENVAIFNNKIIAEISGGSIAFYSNDNGFDWNTSNGAKNLKSNGTSLFSIGSAYSSSTGLTTNKLYSSTDGMTWNTLNTVNLPQTCNGFNNPNPCTGGIYKLLKTNGNEIYIGANYYNSQGYFSVYRVYKTIDNGGSWSLFLSSNMEIIDLVIDNSGTWYAISNYTLLKTLDNGITWFNITPSNFTNRINCIAVENDNIYLGTGIWGGTPSSQGMFKSTDGGLTWGFANSGLSTTLIKQVYSFANNVYAITTNYNNSVGHIFMSSNNGISWTEISSIELNNTVPHKLVFNNNYIFCATENNGIWRNSLTTLSIGSNFNDNNSKEIKLYPNPTNSNFYIDCTNSMNWLGFSVSIRNILGQQVFASNLTEVKQLISLEDKPKGIYFVSIIENENNIITTKKVILN